MIEECKCCDHPDHSQHVSQDGCGGGENRDRLSYLHSPYNVNIIIICNNTSKQNGRLLKMLSDKIFFEKKDFQSQKQL